MTLSSYTWICMIINFLQTRDPPVLPSLHQRPHKKRPTIDGIDVSFDDDLSKLKGFGNPNKETIGELLFHFFRRYGHCIDFDAVVVSVREGKLIPKEQKGWHLKQNNRLCVEEPFNTKRNLSNTADDSSVRGLHMEIRRAFDCLANDVDLTKCCEQYNFPPDEEKPIFERPVPQPKPVISRSVSKNRRGGHSSSNRGTHFHGNTNRNNTQSYRRASSAAMMNGNMPFLPQQPQIPGQTPTEMYYRAQVAQNQLIQDQLLQSFQMLQMRENDLRAYQRVSQVQAQAQAQAHQISAGLLPLSNSSVSGQSNGYPASAEHPSLSAPLPQGVYWQYMPGYRPNAANLGPAHGASTNPSSPSITPAVPELRRSMRRSGTDSSMNSVRSQSQPPARSVPPHPSMQGTPSSFGPMPTSDQQFLQSQLQYQDMIQAAHLRNGVNSSTHNVEIPFDDAPAEYAGYYSPGEKFNAYNARENSAMLPPVPYDSLPSHRRRLTPEQYPLPHLRVDKKSRSPSPLGNDPSFRQGLRSAPLLNGSSQRNFSQLDANDVGPSIVDGSTTSSIPTTSERNFTPSEDSVYEDDRSFRTASSGQDNHEPLGFDTSEHGQGLGFAPQLYAQRLQELHNQAEATALLAGDILAARGTHNGVNGSVKHHQTTFASSVAAPLRDSTNPLLPPENSNGIDVPIVGPVERSTWRPNGGTSPFEIGKGIPDPPQLDKPLVLQPLTPVLETRTPSPTARRSSEVPGTAKANGLKMSLKQAGKAPQLSTGELPNWQSSKQQASIGHKSSLSSSSIPQGSNGILPATEKQKPSVANGHKATLSNGSIPQSNNGGESWQKSVRKKKGSKPDTKGNNSATLPANRREHVPEDESERKGG
jgi:DNA polymerase sigma